MGGGEVLTYAALGPASTRRQIKGYLAESPFLDLSPATKPWAITEVAGRAASKVVPHYHMVNKLNPHLLSRDQAVGRAMAADPLCHDTGTLEGLAGMLDRGANLVKDKVVVKEEVRPVGETGFWVSHGDGDGVVSFDESRKWVQRLQWKDKEFKMYDGWYHRCKCYPDSTQRSLPRLTTSTVHQEQGDCKAQYAKDVSDWILARLG